MNDQISQAEYIKDNISNIKKEIIFHLRKNGKTSLQELSKQFSLSKMGILKHINQLEEQTLIKRFNIKSKTGRGRPTLYIDLDESSNDLFPKAYSSLSVHALQYIDKKLGENGVVEVLQERTNELEKDHRKKFIGQSLEEKVKTLRNIRNEDGYMAELSSTKTNYILDEYNCPIFEVAQAYGHACIAEMKMFENLLGTPVETTHRVVSKDNVCRFLIKKNR